MFGHDAYKIPKLKKEYEVQLNDGSNVLQKFMFFFNEFSRYSRKHQTILELLNDDKTLITSNQLQVDEKESFVIINKKEICYIIDPSLHPAPNASLQKQFLFLLKTGQKINASIYQETPKAQSRMIDYLSEEGSFVELVMDGKHFVYLNKDFILKVIA